MPTTIRVAPIVEGHGESEAVRILLDRTWREIIGGIYCEVIRPLRRSRNELIQESGLERALLHMNNKLAPFQDETPALVLLLLDAHDDPACVLAPRLTQMAGRICAHRDFACVLAEKEFESWFVAAARSLSGFLSLPREETTVPSHLSGRGKGWIEQHFCGHYSPTVDQARLTAAMDLVAVRDGSPSFDKLCRELERRLAS